MATLNISQAQRATGKARTTIQRKIKEGKLSVSKDSEGNPLIDVSELIRVFGPLQGEPDVKKQNDSLNSTPIQGQVAALESLVSELRKDKEWLQRQLEQEQERSRELESRMLPPGEKKGLWARIFG